ncbi:MAG TPA: diacylglycerol kinase [Steroidobacteraceae bacterium]|nr:diacylglycerol kinase [Steroidobacteraceae bacterium]
MTRAGTEYSSERNPHKGNRGLARAWQAARNSWSGLVFAMREESAFRQELTLTALLIPIALLLPFGPLERLMLIGSVVLVLIVELLNSSIEAAIDRISFEHHGLSKRAKDYGSAAVMLSLLTCAMVWITLTFRLLAG